MAVIHKIIIHGRLDGLNDYTAANRTKSYKGAKMKHRNEKLIAAQVPYQMRDQEMKYPVTLTFHWYEKDRRRDPDNICFAKKFILDALVAEQVFPNDSQKYIKGFHDFFHVDKEHPRIEVMIEEGD